MTHADDVLVLQKYSCEKNNTEGKIPFSPSRFVTALFHLVLLFVDWFFSTINFLLLQFLLFSGLTLLMLGDIFHYWSSWILFSVSPQHHPDCPTPQFHPANQFILWLSVKCDDYCCIGWFLWQHWHYHIQKYKAAVQKISCWPESKYLLSCCFLRMMILEALRSQGGGGNDGGKGTFLNSWWCC